MWAYQISKRITDNVAIEGETQTTGGRVAISEGRGRRMGGGGGGGGVGITFLIHKFHAD